METISFEEFKKIDLRVGKVLLSERVEGSEKLIRLEVDFGLELGKRQIIAGIGLRYSPEELLNREALFVANLEPKELMGFKSEGMVLAVTGENGPELFKPDNEVNPGERAK